MRSRAAELECERLGTLTAAQKRTIDDLRAHVGGAHVFANWPTAATPLGKVECCAFSPHSGFLAAGNDKGKVLLWRLNHYPTA